MVDGCVKFGPPLMSPAAPCCCLQDLDLKTYTKMLCGILDIPVHDNPIESLHVLFSL